VAQFIITLLVVLALIAVVVWLVSRYGVGRFAGAGRTPGRPPRLALVDALPVDSRRRLVLVRRDNVEHLLLIGGPADVVVEPAIVRTAPPGARPRPPQAPGQAQPQANQQAPQRPQAQAAAVQPEPAPVAPPAPFAAPGPQASQPAAAQRRSESNGGSEPIPFPQPPRAQPAQPRGGRAEPQPAAPPGEQEVTIEPLRRTPAALQAAASAHFSETTRPTRVESVFSLASTLDDILEETDAAKAEPATPDRWPPGDPLHPEAQATPAAEPAPSEEPAPATAMMEAGEPMAPEAAPADAKVSDLEREMARLLGEITGKRNA
jgi:flagellar biogenesis protein FliO